MHRLGLVDFWFYVNEEFQFNDGHMLLRGSNGSGKSVTMQSFIPLLLDGNKSSERLDSFGTRSRKIENYLIEEDGDRDDRIGYLYLEFKREDSDVYKTIGMGLHARRNKPVDAWYFVIEDNQRINIDLSLMEHNLALTKQMLKNKLGSQVMDNQKEYMDKVNSSLFGFPNREDYKEAISLLMQLRSPKLSNSLKPTMINEILSNSLQPLSEDDLRPMSEAIANMDEIKDQLDALKLSYTAAKGIASTYDQYNHVILDSKAVAYLQKELDYNTSHKVIEAIEKEIKSDTYKQEVAQETLLQLRQEQRILEEEKAGLVKQDIVALADDVARHKEELLMQTSSFEMKEKQEEDKDNQRIDIKNQLQKQRDKKDQIKMDVQTIFHNIDDLQTSLDFEEHQALHDDVYDHLEKPYDYSYTEKRMKEELNSLKDGLMHFQTIHNIESQQQYYLNQREELEIKKEKTESTLLQYQMLFGEMLDEYKERFSTWNTHNRMMQLDDNAMRSLFSVLQQFEVDDCYGKINDILHDLYFKKYQELTTSKTELDILLKKIYSELLAQQKEIDEWTNMKDPTPLMDTFVLENRESLRNHQISHIPLYKLLDFAEDVSGDSQNHFEELLLRSGLLNALVVNREDKTIVLELCEGGADYYVFTDQDVNAMNLIYITKTMAEEHDIASLLTCLSIETKDIQGYDSYFEHPLLTGTISKQVETTFIGERSRERYRALKLLQLHEELKKTEYEKSHKEALLNENLEDLKCLAEEYSSYPKEEDLGLAKQQIKITEDEIEDIIHKTKNVSHEIHLMEQEIMLEKQIISKIATSLGIASTNVIFETRKDNFEEYIEYIQKLKDHHKSYISCHEICNVLQIQFKDLQQDVDILRVECKDVRQQMEILQMRITQKEKQLSNLGYEDVIHRLDEIQSRLQELPKLISKEDQTVGNLSKSISQAQDKLIESKQEKTLRQDEKDQAFEQYVSEVRLQYVIKDETQYGDVKETHRFIEKAYPQPKRKDTLANDLQTSFYMHRGVLQDYNLSRITLFEESEKTARIDITARYQGLRISFFELLVNLSNDIEKQSVLLEDSDRALIEDILVNTISKKIRNHIQNSKRWVAIMNRYMDAMNTSSGLKLNLQWKSHKAENEEELNSEKLVELLEKDVRILKDVDRKRLSTHFRSKITTARKLSEQQDSHESFHQVMRNVMDYRTWFDFRILSQKTGEKKKELTNNAFYAFSGGEKAMAMYIPLFSAVAAKFEGAREDAPLLIALDEAFAGVDEKNINNMFDLIGKFKFDYIMNSQVLWGDYPSVKALAIHELFRPENARYVTAISYEWNGHRKKMVERL